MLALARALSGEDARLPDGGAPFVQLFEYAHIAPAALLSLSAPPPDEAGDSGHSSAAARAPGGGALSPDAALLLEANARQLGSPPDLSLSRVLSISPTLFLARSLARSRSLSLSRSLFLPLFLSLSLSLLLARSLVDRTLSIGSHHSPFTLHPQPLIGEHSAETEKHSINNNNLS